MDVRDQKSNPQVHGLPVQEDNQKMLCSDTEEQREAANRSHRDAAYPKSIWMLIFDVSDFGSTSVLEYLLASQTQSASELHSTLFAIIDALIEV